MASLSDAIEGYLRQLLEQSPSGYVDIQRSSLAEQFDCVPSQITYVLMTRFTEERGFLVEGRRGGGGGIRLVQLRTDPLGLREALAAIDAVDQDRAEHVVDRARDAGYLTVREAAMVAAAVRREVLGVDLPERDRLRARLLKAMLITTLRPEGAYAK